MNQMSKRHRYFDAFCEEHLYDLRRIYLSLDTFFRQQVSLNDWILFAYEHTSLPVF